MKPILAILAIAVATVCQAATPAPKPAAPKVVPAAKQTAEGRWIVIGPGLKILDAGVYIFIFAPSDQSQQATVTLMDATGGVTPVPPAPVQDLRANLAAEIAKVVDPQKATTAGTLSKAIAASIPGAKDGTIPKESILTVLGFIGPTQAGWSGFFAVLTPAVKSAASGQAVADVLQIAVDELGKVK